MEIALTLAGVVVGSAGTLIAQLAVRRREERERWVGVMLEACASIYMLEDEYLACAGMAHPPPYFASERFQRWSRQERALAGARLRLVADQERLHEIESELRASGKRLWWLAREAGPAADPDDFETKVDCHRELLEEFVSTARTSLRRGSVRP